jgi:putative ABC transport system ATP-binding protein
VARARATAEQDSASRELVLSRMLGLAEAGKSLVLATHDPEVAQRCDRVVNLADLRPGAGGRYGLAAR